MKNQRYMGTPTGPRFVLCPTTVLAGDLVLVGKDPACALNNYQSNSGGATFYFGGTFDGTVHGSSTHSPFTPAAIKPGDPLYATGTLDSATNVTTGLTITGDSSDTRFGSLDESYSSGVGSGATDTAAPIRLGGGN
jgi:hypothetical protein